MGRDAARQPEQGREPNWPPQKLPHEEGPVHLGGTRPWDPGGKPPREKSKRPVEAIDIAPGIDAHKQNKNTWPCKSQVSQTAPATEKTMHLPHLPLPHAGRWWLLEK